MAWCLLCGRRLAEEGDNFCRSCRSDVADADEADRARQQLEEQYGHHWSSPDQYLEMESEDE